MTDKPADYAAMENKLSKAEAELDEARILLVSAQPYVDESDPLCCEIDEFINKEY